MKKTASSYDFDVKWYPYLLNPTDFPNEGVDKRVHYAKKFGADRFDGMAKNMANVGNEVGIKFKTDAIVGNTIRSHRLVEYAERQGKQNEVVEEIMKQYFEEGKNLGSFETLLDVAKTAGLDVAKTKSYLESDEDKDWVIQQDRKAKDELDVEGVPYFTVNDNISFSGAQTEEFFEDVFQKIEQNANL